MLDLSYMMIVVRRPFTAFALKNTPMLREYQYNVMGFDFLFLGTSYQCSRAHDSTIPAFQHSSSLYYHAEL